MRPTDFCHPTNFEQLHPCSRFSNLHSRRMAFHDTRLASVESLGFEEGSSPWLRPYAIKPLTPYRHSIGFRPTITSRFRDCRLSQGLFSPRSVKNEQVQMTEGDFLRWRSSFRTFARSLGSYALGRFVVAVSLDAASAMQASPNSLRFAQTLAHAHRLRKENERFSEPTMLSTEMLLIATQLTTDFCNTY